MEDLLESMVGISFIGRNKLENKFSNGFRFFGLRFYRM